VDSAKSRRWFEPRGVAGKYAIALAALLAAVLLRWVLDPILGNSFPLVTLYGAVGAAMWVGGYRPAVLVILVGYLACAFLFIEPRGEFGFTDSRNLVGFLVFFSTTAALVGLAEARGRRVKQESERRLRAIFETAGVSLWEHDFSKVQTAIDSLKAEGITDFERYFREHPEFVDRALGLVRITNANEASVRLLEARSKEELLAALPTAPHPESRKAFEAQLVALAEHRPFLEAEAVMTTLRGNDRHVVFTMVPPRADHSYDCVLFSVFDITAQKAAEAALREANQKKDEFLAMLSHELRNPLAPMANALEIMKMTRGDPVAFDKARGMIERQVHQLKRLTDDLLDVSRFTRGKLELRREDVDLRALLAHVVEDLRPSATSLGHVIEVDLPDEPLWVHGDPSRLAQVFENLLENACKYTPAEGRIVLSAARVDGDAVVSVRDDGVGIPIEMQPRIFEMFAQVDSTFDRARGGLGIGLGLVKQITELHGGSVMVLSDGRGTGAEFRVRLALADVEPKRDALSPARNGEHSKTPLRILVVDDNEDSATSLAALLSLSGHTMQVAHDGVQALQEAQRFRPEVVLLDIGLPGVNGFGVCRRIREAPWGKAMRIVALTGWGHKEARQNAVDAGFDDHLLKPVDFAALGRVLATVPRT
jgi:signal transduction histidine kinase